MAGDVCGRCGHEGELLCCQTCPRAFHLSCVVPPLQEIPLDDWFCSVCATNAVTGVTDCVRRAEKDGIVRLVPLGEDQAHRTYVYMSRLHIVGRPVGVPWIHIC